MEVEGYVMNLISVYIFNHLRPQAVTLDSAQPYRIAYHTGRKNLVAVIPDPRGRVSSTRSIECSPIFPDVGQVVTTWCGAVARFTREHVRFGDVAPCKSLNYSELLYLSPFMRSGPEDSY